MQLRSLRLPPRYLFVILANALPVYGVITGKIVFFQVLWIFWVETLILAVFDLIRIAAARGTGAGNETDPYLLQALAMTGDTGAWTLGRKLGMMFRTAMFRIFILGFYLVFLIVFIGLQVTDDASSDIVGECIGFRNTFVNTALGIFIINGCVQLIGGFFMNGLYRRVSPRLYTNPFDARTILMHIMIVTSGVIHAHVFENKPYAWVGEIVYVGVFMLIRTVLEIRQLLSVERNAPEPVVMI